MPRFFVFQELIPNETIVITGEDARHIIKALRYKPGDFLKISDGENTDGTAVIEETNIKSSEIKIKVLEKNKVDNLNPAITLLQGLPKSDKFEAILQKNTEVGVKCFTPIITERTVAQPSAEKLSHRRKRWQKIVKEASKQCMRTDIPEVKPAISFEESLKEIKNHDLILIPWEEEDKTTLKSVLRGLDKDIRSIAVYIGPEGGFSREEVKKAKEVGAISCTLGSNILRTETAGLVTNSAILYELGDLGGLQCQK